jgi:four helix bundle protein
MEDWKVKNMANTQRRLIFECSKVLPKTESYSLTDQIRRSSRSVTANIAEAYARRRYPAHLASKMSDAEAENAETRVWLDVMVECNYRTFEQLQEIYDLNNQISNLLNYMIRHTEKFTLK